MAYRTEQTNTGDQIVIDGWEKGIQQSPYLGISNIRNLNTVYYPGVAYVNYRRQAATLTETGTFWYAGTHSTNISDNVGWIFTGSSTVLMTNPISKAVSTNGLIYIQDDTGQIWKQTSVNSSTFNLLGYGGRFANGNKGIAFWQNYLAVFGDGVIEFCGDGTGDAGITSSNWNIVTNSIFGSVAISTNYAVTPNNIFYSNVFSTFPSVNEAVTFTTTGALPAPLVVGTTYYILTVDTSSSPYVTISTSIGGSAVILTNDGSGTNTMSFVCPNSNLPLGNSTNASLSISTSTVFLLTSYVSPAGISVSGAWKEATGLYNIILTNGQKIPANFINNSNVVNLLSNILYFGSSGLITGATISLIDTTVPNYKPYVSKVDGSLYFANGQFLGRIAITSSPNITFNPSLGNTYSVSTGVTALPEQFTDTIVDMVDLKNQLVIAGQKDVYTWDYISASTSSPGPVGEPITSITNLLNNIYILAGQKGNIYVSNWYSAQFLTKLPDYIAGVFDPVWNFGGLMTHRSRLYFQASAQTTSGANILAGVFSLMVSPAMLGEEASGLVMEAQNSYGLTPASGALSTGVLIDASPSSSGQDSYYSAWSNGASTGGIDYNNTSLWQNNEPIIETDIIPIGTILQKSSFGNIEFKLDRPMVAGDSITMYWRSSLSDSYQLIGTTTTAVLADYKPSKIAQAQWAQFKVTFSCASSGSSFIPLREIRIHQN